MRISDWSSDVCSSDLQNHLAHRACPGIAVRQEVIARELLRDRRGALHPAAGAVILYRERRGARHADGIDARMIAKAPVLDRDHRILHHLWRFATRQPARTEEPRVREEGVSAC